MKSNNQKRQHRPRITGEIKYRGCHAKVNNMSIDEFLKTVAALECKNS